MKTGLRRFTGVLGLAVLAAGSAQALTTIDMTDGNGGDIPVSIAQSGNITDIDFSWGTVPASGYVKFTAGNSFDLFLTAYNGPLTPTVERSGVIVLADGGPRYTTSGNFCEAAYVIADIRGRCDLSSNGPAGVGVYNPSSVDPILTLAAGTYYVGYAESGLGNGEMSFRISEVPLPAGGMLLIGALGGLAALRRRKKAS